jgi:hypothetical protein
VRAQQSREMGSCPAGASRHRRYLSKVLLVDRDGRTQLSLAWDSYSDDQFDQRRTALRLPDETRP